MKLNRLMGRYLQDLRSREVEAALAPRGPDVRIVEAGGCFLLGGFLKKPHLSAADFPDQTGLECSANKLRMEAMFDARIASSCPLLLLTAGLVTARTVSEALSRYPGRFNVIVSYDGGELRGAVPQNPRGPAVAGRGPRGLRRRRRPRLRGGQRHAISGAALRLRSGSM